MFCLCRFGMDNKGGIMKSYSNWIANTTNTTWKHRHNPKVVVTIVKTNGYYHVFHSHPGPNNTAIMQEYEVARSMKSARERAERHLTHWSNYKNWPMDKDFGKIGIRGT